MEKVSVSHLISFSRYQTKCVIKFLLRQLMTSWKIFLGSTSKATADSGKNMGRRKYKNWNILRTEIAFYLV